MRDEKVNVAQALQVVVDMITDCGPEDRMSARVAMLLHLIEVRVGSSAYCAMLKELEQFIAFETKEIASEQKTRAFQALWPLVKAWSGQE
jgi:hypothetical protein